MTDIIARPSPNFDDRTDDIRLIVLHYTGMQSGAEAIERLCDPAAKVSAHYVVEEDGQVFSLVEEAKRAWHAGRGGWGPFDAVNDVSVGIEIVNPGHLWGYRDFPDVQVEAVIRLVSEISARHNLTKADVIGHSDLAPERKEDPGERFPWDRLADKGLAFPTYKDGVIDTLPDYEAAIQMLVDIGYRVTLTEPVAATLAFQRRFCPYELGQGLSSLTRSAIATVHQWAAAR